MNMLCTPRDWQQIAQGEAATLIGTLQAESKIIEARRYGCCADEIERLRQCLRHALVFLEHPDVNALPFVGSPSVLAEHIRAYLPPSEKSRTEFNFPVGNRPADAQGSESSPEG